MSKFGPSRAEIKFRLWASLAGLALLAVALLVGGLPMGPAAFEIIAIAGAFFGGTFIWSLVKLRKRPPESDET